MACALHSSQPSPFESQSQLNQRAVSEGSQLHCGGTPSRAMASRRSGSQGSLAASGGSGDDELLDTSERQELLEHDDDEASPALLKAQSTAADFTKTPRHDGAALKRLNTPGVSPHGAAGQTQVPETPDASLDADKSTGHKDKSTLSPQESPKRATARVRRQGSASSSEQSPAAVAEEDALELDEGDQDSEAKASRGAPPGPAAAADAESASSPYATGEEGAGMSSGEKRPREGEGVQQNGIDAQVESHRRGAEQSSKVYHDLLAKRQRLKREVEGAKNLEKSRRDLLKKIEQDKAAQADKERDLREANVAMAEAHKTVLAAQQAKRKQASLSIAREAEIQEVVREQKECDERLKMHTEEFYVLLAKNNASV